MTVYIVTDKAGNENLVETRNASVAQRHVANQILTTRKATHAEIVDRMKRGIIPETVDTEEKVQEEKSSDEQGASNQAGE